MSGTVQTQSQLLAALADGQAPGSIRPVVVRNLTVSIPSLAGVNAMNGGPGVVALDGSNNAIVQTAAVFPSFGVTAAVAGRAFTFTLPYNVQIQSVTSGVVVGGGSCPFTVTVLTSNNVTPLFLSAPTLSGASTTTVGMSLFWNLAAGQYCTITLGTITGTITSGFIQLNGIYQ